MRSRMAAYCWWSFSIKVVDRHQTTPPLDRLAEGRLGIDGLGHGVDVREADLNVLGPKRHQAPSAWYPRCARRL